MLPQRCPLSRCPQGTLQPCAQGNVKSRGPLNEGGLKLCWSGSLRGSVELGWPGSRHLPPGGSLGSEMRTWQGTPGGSTKQAGADLTGRVLGSRTSGDSFWNDGPRATWLLWRSRLTPYGQRASVGGEWDVPSPTQKLHCGHQRPGWPSEDGARRRQGVGHPGLERPPIPRLHGACPQALYPEWEAARST